MPSKLYQRLIKNGLWRRLVTSLLLGLALFDLTVVDLIAPQVCNDGVAILAAGMPVESAGKRSNETAPVAIAISDQGSSPKRDSHSDSSPASTEEDCFCCCSHIMLGYPVDCATLNKMPRIEIPSIASRLSPPPQDTFHPPRLS